MKASEKTITSGILAIVLVSSFAQIATALPPGYSLTEEDRLLENGALQFLTDVAQFNTSSYNVEMAVDDKGGSGFDKILKFNLTSETGKVDVLFLVNNYSLFWCTINPVKGSPAYLDPAPSDTLTEAKDTLDRLQSFSSTEYLPSLRSMLDSINELEASKISNANYAQEISVSGNTVTISWEPYANGLSNQQDKLTLEFKEGHLTFFCNYLDQYTLGDLEVKISEAQAIQIAAERVETFSYEQNNVSVSNMTALKESAITELTLQRKINNTLYPHWNILMPLDKMYPGGVTAFRIMLWADTGEVTVVTPVGFYGEPKTSPVQTSEGSPLPTQLVPEYTVVSIVLLMVTITLVAASFRTSNRRRKAK